MRWRNRERRKEKCLGVEKERQTEWKERKKEKEWIQVVFHSYNLHFSPPDFPKRFPSLRVCVFTCVQGEAVWGIITPGGVDSVEVLLFMLVIVLFTLCDYCFLLHYHFFSLILSLYIFLFVFLLIPCVIITFILLSSIAFFCTFSFFLVL